MPRKHLKRSGGMACSRLIDKLDPTMWYILKIYYDSSRGTIDLGDGLLSDIFIISFGVKQGGILSPPLFHAHIDDLIFECTNANIGAIFNKLKGT